MVVVATVQSATTNDAEHSPMETFGTSGGVASTATVRVDVAVASVEVAAEKETAVVPEERIRLNVQFPLPSVDVVASIASYATVTIEEADVVPVNVTLVVANRSFSFGESTERESAGADGAGVEAFSDETSVVCVGLPPLEPPLEPPELLVAGAETLV